MTNLTDLAEWQALADHQRDIANQHMRDWFDEKEGRFQHFSLKWNEFFLDFSRNRIDKNTLNLLENLAKKVGLAEKISDFFSGKSINITEKRPALHMALRDKNRTKILINNQNIAAEIAATQQKMFALVDQVHAKKWLGSTGKPIKFVVTIGIGGSHLGPQMCVEALKDFAISELKFYFISSVDQSYLNDVLAEIDPETTLFILSSKSFTTLETMTNAETIIAWLRSKLNSDVIKQHFIGITATPKKALEFGIAEENIFPMWDWVGGRYSVWSAIGLPLALMIGSQQFAEFLTGAFEMDQHFQHTDFSVNMPVLLALIGIWYINFFGTQVQAIIPYSHRLRMLIAYLQQAEMESNGKSVNLHGEPLNYTTSTVIFGAEGCDGQHAYHQLLHQGRQLIPADFIVVGEPAAKNKSHQPALIASALSQTQALMRGKTHAEAKAELLAANYAVEEADFLARHRVIDGNKPCNILLMQRLTPKNLGALIALYEHKIFVQGAIWGINSFDQFGVELGKQLLPNILQHLRGEGGSEIDVATRELIRRLRNE